jgi:hypothetical protein
MFGYHHIFFALLRFMCAAHNVYSVAPAAEAFLFSSRIRYCYFSFCLDAKRNKKIKANAKLRSFAIPRLPMCNGVLLYFLACCVMVYHYRFIFMLR